MFLLTNVSKEPDIQVSALVAEEYSIVFQKWTKT